MTSQGLSFFLFALVTTVLPICPYLSLQLSRLCTAQEHQAKGLVETDTPPGLCMAQRRISSWLDPFLSL